MRFFPFFTALGWIAGATAAISQSPAVIAPPPAGAPVAAPPQTNAPQAIAPVPLPNGGSALSPAPGASLPAARLPARSPQPRNPLTLTAALALAAQAAHTTQAEQATQVAQQAAKDAPAHLVPSVNASAGIAPSESEPSRLESGVLLTFPLGLPGARLGVRATRAMARASAAQSAAALAVSDQAMAQGVVRAFFAVAADQSEQEAARQSVRLAKSSLDAARLRHQVGVAPSLDVLRARSAVETSQAAFAAATAALRGDRRALARWLGVPFHEHVMMPALPASLPDNPVAADLMHVPLAQAAAARAAGATAAAETAEAALSPQASLGAGVETRGPTAGPALVLALNLPLDTRLLQAQEKAARAAQETAAAGEFLAVRQAAAEYLTARAAAQAALARLPDLQSADADAQQVAQADLAAYRLGAVPSSELILAQQQAAATHSAWGMAQVQAAQSVALLQTYVITPEGDHP